MTIRLIPVVNWPEKSIIPPSRYISVVKSYLLWALSRYKAFFTNWISSSNFAYSTTVKPIPSAE